jgi:hypothetical protein
MKASKFTEAQKAFILKQIRLGQTLSTVEESPEAGHANSYSATVRQTDRFR